MNPFSITSRIIIKIYIRDHKLPKSSKKINKSSSQFPLDSSSAPLRERLRIRHLFPFNSSSKPLEIHLAWTLSRTSGSLISLPLNFAPRNKARGGLEYFIFSHSIFLSNRNSYRIAFDSLRVSTDYFTVVIISG